MPIIDLANPTRFLSIVNRLLPWLAAATVLVFAFGLARIMNAPDDYQQGATVKIMYPARAGGLARHDVLGRDDRRRARHAGLAASAVGRRRQGGGADRHRLHLHLPDHRLALGPPDLGHLLGVGRQADLDAGAVPALSRRAGALLDRGRSRPRFARGGHPGAGRRHQYSDHQVFRGILEHAASAGLAVPQGRLGHRSLDPHSAAGHGRRRSRCCSSRCISPPCATRFCAGACAPCG